MEGWIKIHRKMANWQWLDSMNHFNIFMHLLMRANHKETIWRNEVIKPGQVLTGTKQLEDISGLKSGKIRRVLLDLEKSGEISRQTTNKYSIITILKWNEYQICDNQTNNKQQSNEKQTTTSKNEKNVKNEKNEKKQELLNTFAEAPESASAKTENPAAISPQLNASRETWAAYEQAYVSRYGVKPLRNAQVNTLVKRLILYVGAEVAPILSRFYVSHNDAWYVKNAHPVNLLLRDASKLCTEMQRGEQITTQAARSVEKKQEIVNAFSKHLTVVDE